VWAPSPDSEPRIRYVDADGVRIRTSVRGTGPPLLLLTGIGASLELSAPLERALDSHGVQTLAMDAPGTGGSSRYRWPRRMPGLTWVIPNARLEIIRGGGHLFLLERPTELAALIATFLMTGEGDHLTRLPDQAPGSYPLRTP